MKKAMFWLMLLLQTISISQTIEQVERKGPEGIAFVTKVDPITKDRTLVPLLPVELIFKQESGGIADGTLVCDVYCRGDKGKNACVMILKCGKGELEKVLLIRSINFTGNKR